jgi:hypothetical protein
LTPLAAAMWLAKGTERRRLPAFFIILYKTE